MADLLGNKCTKVVLAYANVIATLYIYILFPSLTHFLVVVVCA